MDNQTTSIATTCKEAQRLSSEALDRELSLVERTRLRLHLFACPPCDNVNGQMHLIRRAMRSIPLADELTDDKKMG